MPVPPAQPVDRPNVTTTAGVRAAEPLVPSADPAVDPAVDPADAVLDDELLQLCYVSASVGVLGDGELLDLLAHARERNASRAVTGVLLYHDGAFVQVLEGPPGGVRAVFASIASDPRHERVHVLYESPVAARDFPGWRMGFVPVGEHPATAVDGFVDFVAACRELSTTHQASRARRVLARFVQRPS